MFLLAALKHLCFHGNQCFIRRADDTNGYLLFSFFTLYYKADTLSTFIEIFFQWIFQISIILYQVKILLFPQFLKATFYLIIT